MSATIRPAGAADAALVARIVRESFRTVAERFGLTAENCPRHPANCTEDWISEALEGGVRCFVLEDEGRPCGCVALERADEQTAYLGRLAVLPDCRGRGFGRALVERVLAEARAAGLRRVRLGLIAADEPLRGWYERLGFREVERRPFEHLPFEVLFMSRELPDEKPGAPRTPTNGL
jgi:ribosomal protein S18 acetylase RimI-like enzyme